ncbi:MAG: hypothetical protein WAR57_07205 [Candidatus Phosphoribacter sp.]|nr:hypothetical protein [Actinomycetales bacterium]
MEQRDQDRSQLAQFVEMLNSDPKLRQRLEVAEREAADRTQQLKDDLDRVNRENMAVLQAIASERGLDLSLDLERPDRLTTPSDMELQAVGCWLTCCFVLTSVWDGEGIPTVDGPGCGPGSTSDCPF